MDEDAELLAEAAEIDMAGSQSQALVSRLLRNLSEGDPHESETPAPTGGQNQMVSVPLGKVGQEYEYAQQQQRLEASSPPLPPLPPPPLLPPLPPPPPRPPQPKQQAGATALPGVARSASGLGHEGNSHCFRGLSASPPRDGDDLYISLAAPPRRIPWEVTANPCDPTVSRPQDPRLLFPHYGQDVIGYCDIASDCRGTDGADATGSIAGVSVPDTAVIAGVSVDKTSGAAATASHQLIAAAPITAATATAGDTTATTIPKFAVVKSGVPPSDGKCLQHTQPTTVDCDEVRTVLPYIQQDRAVPILPP